MAEKTLSGRLARDILGKIQGGEFLPGDKLNAQDLASGLRVSRTPVLKALKILADSGIAEHRPNRGYAVADTPPPAKIKNLKEPSSASDFYFRLADDWVAGRISQDVTEQFLLQNYGVKRSEITSTLFRATNEGWAERKPGYGWTLLPVVNTPEAFEQVYRFRAAIEPAALLEPTFELDFKVLDELQRIQERYLDGLVETETADRLVLVGLHFHEAIIKLSGNIFFHQALVRVNRLRRLLEIRSSVDRKRVYDQFSGHLELIGLLRRGDPVAAAYYMRQHLAEAAARKSSLQRAHDRDYQVDI